MTSARSSRPSKVSLPASDTASYRGRRIAVGTRHGKQHQFAPAFHSFLGAELVTPTDLDTDQFGTFSGETPRPGPAVDAARAKARLAMTVTGLPFGLASEASYGPLPGGWHGHEEILLFCDDTRGTEVLEGHRSATVPGFSHRVAGWADTPASLLAGLPRQALIVRPADPLAEAIVKGVTDTAALESAVVAAAASSRDGLAIVEPDLRAHHNPSRRQVLARLAITMARRLATACPRCGTPGFGRVDTEPGLPCRVCETPTSLPRSEIHACAACAHQVARALGKGADPALCPHCNP